jgi:hypothetical protein
MRRRSPLMHTGEARISARWRAAVHFLQDRAWLQEVPETPPAPKRPPMERPPVPGHEPMEDPLRPGSPPEIPPQEPPPAGGVARIDKLLVAVAALRHSGRHDKNTSFRRRAQQGAFEGSRLRFRWDALGSHPLHSKKIACRERRARTFHLTEKDRVCAPKEY